MSDEQNTDSTDPNFDATLAELETIGAGNSGAMAEMAKGMSAGFRDMIAWADKLTTMHKGSKAPAEDDDEPEPESKDEDDDGDDDDDDEGDTAGVSDMYKGDNGVFDVTEFVAQETNARRKLATKVTKLQKAVDNLPNAIAKMVGGQNAEFAGQLAKVLVPLAKGVVDIRSDLESVTEASTVGPRLGMPRALKRVAHTAPTGPAAQLDKVQLYKAVSTNVISTEQNRYFTQHGNFGNDEAHNKALVEKIANL